MGRQLKRVPLDFAHPLNEVWPGFLNPWYEHSHACGKCGGTGYSEQANNFSAQWYGNAPFDPVLYGANPLTIDSLALRDSVARKLEISQRLADQDGKPEWYTRGGRISFEHAVKVEIKRMFDIQRNQWMHHLIQADVDALVGAGRLYDFTHDWSKNGGWQPKAVPCKPTADEVNAWSLSGMGHDSINRSVCVDARCGRERVPRLCDRCNGAGNFWIPADAEAKAEAWQPEEPPRGNGYQLWETASEGSPITPVFSRPEELASWLVENDDSITSDTTYDQWMRFIQGPGWAPSMVGGPVGFRSGVKACSISEAE